MIKLQVIDFKDKKSAQEKEELNMTPEQHLELTFQLMDLSIALTQSKEMPGQTDSIQWIDLHVIK